MEPVCPNRNCFYTSIALNLIHNMKENKNILQNIVMKKDESITLMLQSLEKYWFRSSLGLIGLNIRDGDKYESEANKVLQDGYFF